MESITIGIRGMTCQGCVASVKRVLEGIDGVEGVDVTLNPARLHSAIEGAGFEVVR